MRVPGVLTAGLLGVAMAGGPATARQTQPASRAEAEEKKPATVTAGRDGFKVKSAGGDFVLRLRGILQLDGSFFQDDGTGAATDTFQIARGRPIVEATLNRIYDFRIVPDFGLGKTVLQDAYLDARFHAAAKVRAGKFKTPFGLERLQSSADLMFVSRALPTNLVPNRDLGIMLHGDVLEGVLAYAGGVLNGVPDGGSGDGDINDGKEMAARLFVRPFRKTSRSGLRGLGIGLAMTRGINRGKPTATGLGSYRTAGRQAFFSYRAGSTPAASDTVVADGSRRRLSPQIYYYSGRFGLMGELVRSSQEVRIGETGAIQKETVRNGSWQVSASFFVTRDTAAYKAVAPSEDFLPSGRTPGGIEITARWGRLSVDRDSFPIFADPEKSAREASEAAPRFFRIGGI